MGLTAFLVYPVSYTRTYNHDVTEPAFQQMTEEEYLRTEEFSRVKREFVAGYVYPLHGETLAQAGVTNGHSELVLAIAVNLRPFARKQGCKIYQADMWVNTQTSIGKAVNYPDVTATCEPMGSRATSANAPCFIAEVLQPQICSDADSGQSVLFSESRQKHNFLLEPIFFSFSLWSGRIEHHYSSGIHMTQPWTV